MCQNRYIYIPRDQYQSLYSPLSPAYITGAKEEIQFTPFNVMAKAHRCKKFRLCLFILFFSINQKLFFSLH